MSKGIVENYEVELLTGVMSYELKDDSTPYGGVSFVGETVKDFMEEAGMPYDSTLKELNEELEKCGIEKVDWEACSTVKMWKLTEEAERLELDEGEVVEVPYKVVKFWIDMKHGGMWTVEEFLEDHYISQDTSGILDLCKVLNNY